MAFPCPARALSGHLSQELTPWTHTSNPLEAFCKFQEAVHTLGVPGTGPGPNTTGPPPSQALCLGQSTPSSQVLGDPDRLGLAVSTHTPTCHLNGPAAPKDLPAPSFMLPTASSLSPTPVAASPAGVH